MFQKGAKYLNSMRSTDILPQRIGSRYVLEVSAYMQSGPISRRQWKLDVSQSNFSRGQIPVLLHCDT